jgi:hypothetical protein
MVVEPMEPAQILESMVVEPASILEPIVPPPTPASILPPQPASILPATVMAGKMQCPRCGRLLRIRTLAEKHTCARKPRAPWKMNPEKLLARRRAAAERRFLARCGGEGVKVDGGIR